MNNFEHLPKRFSKSSKMTPAFGEFIVQWDRHPQIRLRCKKRILNACHVQGAMLGVFVLFDSPSREPESWCRESPSETGARACASLFFHTAPNCMIFGSPKIPQRKLHSKDWTPPAYHRLLKYGFRQYPKVHHFGYLGDLPVFSGLMKLQTLELSWSFFF